MARCLGGNCPYGYGHHDMHVIAGRKSWVTRRRGQRHAAAEEGRLLQHATGKVSALHYHRTARGGRYVFRQGGQYYSLTPDEYRNYVEYGMSVEQAKRSHKDRLERIEQRHLREQERNPHYKRSQARYRAEQEKAARRMDKEERRQVRSMLGGGIKRYRHHDTRGRETEKEEYDRGIPAYFRAKKGERRGYTMDEAAEQLKDNMPWLGIRDANDLREYLTYGRRKAA